MEKGFSFDSILRDVDRDLDILETVNSVDVGEAIVGDELDYSGVPHIVLDTVLFSKVLKVLGGVVKGIARDEVLGGVHLSCIERDGEMKVRVLATDFDTTVEAYLPYVGYAEDDDILQDCIVRYKSLLQVVGYTGGKTVIMDIDGSLQVGVFGGYADIKGSFDITDERFYNSRDVDDKVEWDTGEWADFEEVVGFVIPFAISSLKPDDRRIFFGNGKVSVKHLWSVTEAKWGANETFSVGAKEILVVYGLGRLLGCNKISVNKSDMRVDFVGDNFKVSTNCGRSDERKLSIISIGEVLDGGIDISGRVREIIKFGGVYDNTFGKVIFNEEDGIVSIGVVFQGDKVYRYVAGEGRGINNKLELQCKILDMFLSAYGDGSRVRFGSNGITISKNGMSTRVLGREV